MISKDRVDEVEEDDHRVTTPGKSDQVISEIKADVCNMLGSSTLIRTIPGDEESHRDRDGSKDTSDNVHNLLGRSFNGDLIASQVFLCITCGIELDDAESLRQHELNCVPADNSRHIHTPTMVLDEGEGFRKLVCEICRAYFSETDHLQEHKLLHLNTSNVCYLCDTFFANRYLLARHVVCQHSERFGVKQNEEGVHEPYTCAICILRFSTLISLQAHEDSHEVTEKTPACRVCSVSNASHQALQSHLKSSLHAEMKLQLQNLFTCIDCSTVFHCRDAYAMHMMMRAKDESCKKTPRVISAKTDTLTNPNIVVVKEEPIDPTSPDCPDTSTQFPRHPEGSSLASRPTRSESPGTTHVCPACGMVCCDSNHLLMHLRMCGSVLSPQTNDHTWVQSQNGLVFKWAVNKTYSLHLPGSMARKEKKCSYCHKSFLDQDDLAMHVMSDHTGDLNDLDRTSTPPEPNVWRKADRNGICSLPTYSPSGLVAFDPRVNHHSVSSSNKLMEHQIDPKHHFPILSAKDLRSSQNSEATVASRTSVTSSSNSAPSVDRKRRHGRSQSTVFRSNHQPDEIRSKSADIPVNSFQSEAKHPRLSTPPARCTGRVRAYSPLDLSKGLRETDLTDSPEKDNQEKSDLGSANCERVTNSDNSKRQAQLVSQSDEVQNEESHPVSNSHEGANNSDSNADPPLLEFLLENRRKLFQCPYCNIVFFDRTLYCLHMGLHNVNNPWQCNMCGKAFDNVHQFSSHVLHF